MRRALAATGCFHVDRLPRPVCRGTALEQTVTFAEFSIGYDGRNVTAKMVDVMRFDGPLVAENARVLAE